MNMETVDIRPFIHEAKLVIGNGFDLRCGLHSSYQDYFRFKEKQYSWFSDVLRGALANQRFFHSYDVNNFPKTMPDSLNFWDLVFYLLSEKKAQIENWCDVEDVIKKCLFEEQPKWSISFLDLSEQIMYFVKEGQHYVQQYEQSDLFLFKHFLLEEVRVKHVHDKRSFFRFLLDELKKFERDFINYLKEDIEKVDYQRNASELVTKIFGNSQYRIAEIDSFNYTRFQHGSALFHNINGDFVFPIFGVDSSGITDIDDDRRIFTKQYRKLELLLNGQAKQPTRQEECVIFYGHSLNEQDYDYFFTLFDRLDLLNESSKKLVFAYSVYDKEKESVIKKTMINRIYSLFFAYERSKGIQNPRLITKMIESGQTTIKPID